MLRQVDVGWKLQDLTQRWDMTLRDVLDMKHFGQLAYAWPQGNGNWKELTV